MLTMAAPSLQCTRSATQHNRVVCKASTSGKFSVKSAASKSRTSEGWFTELASKVTAASAAALILSSSAAVAPALAEEVDESNYNWPYPSDTQRRKDSKSWSFGPLKFEKADWDNYADKGEYVEWIAIKDGETVTSPLEFAMLSHGVSVSPVQAGNLKNFGHFYVIVDEGAAAKGEKIPTDDAHINFDKGQLSGKIDLPEGQHKVTLQFADADGFSYGEKLSNTITLTVVDPQLCGEKDLFCYKTPTNTDEPVYSGAPQDTETCLGCGFEVQDVSKRNLPKAFSKPN